MKVQGARENRNSNYQKMKRTDFVEELNISRLITEIKKLAEKNHLSAQRIYDLIEEEGDHVSLNTIKKVLMPGSEELNYNYHLSIQPIARVLNGVYGDDSGDAAIDGLRAAIRVKDAVLERKDIHIADLERKVEWLKGQILLKDQRIDRLFALLEKQTESEE